MIQLVIVGCPVIFRLRSSRKDRRTVLTKGAMRDLLKSYDKLVARELGDTIVGVVQRVLCLCTGHYSLCYL